MAFHLYVSGCGHYLAPSDSHDYCLTCLGYKHAEAAFIDEKCGVPSVIPHFGFSAPQRTSSVNTEGDLRIVVGALPPGQSPGASHSSHTSQVVEFPDEPAGASHRG